LVSIKELSNFNLWASIRQQCRGESRGILFLTCSLEFKL
jgi:hypothetical protein